MESEPTLPSDEPAWYCVRTQTKREHLAAKSLAQLEGLQSFCPRLRYRKATRRGKIWWVEAMFPGYIFAFFSRLQLERDVVHTHGVMKLLRFGNYVPEIPAAFVAELIEQMANQDGEVEDTLTLQPMVKEGDEVEVANGALQGFQGKVVEILPAIERVKILVEFLGDHQVVETDLFSLILPSKPIPE
ncbi:MAG: transcription termination/antitermination protein NusG [Akkermansiaceae bacterium]